MGFKTTIFKQYNPGAWLGAAVSLYGGTSIYQAMINSFLISATAYHTTMRDTIHLWFPWMTFPMFFASILILFIFIMAAHYKFVMPSMVAFSNFQSYKHQNLVRKDIAKVMARLDNLEALIRRETVE